MKIKIFEFCVFSIFLALGIFFYRLASENIFPLVHGPYYFSIALSLLQNSSLDYYALYPWTSELVYTLQIGISIVQYICLIITKKYWFIIFYIISSLGWLLAYKEFKKLSLFNLNSIDYFILIFLFFLQPYNINQLANFSNEAIYIPFLIYSFFLIFNNKNSLGSLLIFSLFIIFGIFFRIHHAVFCFSVFLYFALIKDYGKLKFIFCLGLLKIFLFLFVIFNTSLNSVFFDHIDFINITLSDFFNTEGFVNDPHETDDMNFSIKENKILSLLFKFLTIISSPLLTNKFISNEYIAFLVNLICSIIVIFSIFEIRKTNYKLFILTLIYLFFSSLFILILPFFEYSYQLPYSFLIILSVYLFIKKYLGKYFYSISLFIFLIAFMFLTSIYLGYYKIKNIEIYNNRVHVEKIKKLYELYSPNHNIYYAHNTMYHHIEDYFWHKDKKPFCKLNATLKSCIILLNKNKFQNVIIIHKLKRNIKISDFEIETFKESNNLVIKKEINFDQFNAIIFEKK